MYVRPTGLGGKKKGVPRDEAKRVVQSIYLELLLRDPWNPHDAGAEGYVNCLVDGWCDTDFVRTEVIKQPEYRDAQERAAREAFAGGTTTPGGLVPTVGGAPTGGFIPGGFDLQSIMPFVLLGGLLLVLKK